MATFQETLRRLGLSQYHDTFVAEAFDSWEVLLDVTEEDLEKLEVKLGHRRVLQRAIADYHRDGTRSSTVTYGFIPDQDKNRIADGYASIEDRNSVGQLSNRVPGNGKRKYRRHPKPDENAPDRPPSAYVLFSNHVRENLKAHEMSFTEIAKAVGERWQALAPDEKAVYESRSQAMKDTFYAQLAVYKKTPEYAEYQHYLAEFKLKHEGQGGDNKRRKDEKQPQNSANGTGCRDESSPENRASSTHSSDRQFTERRSPLGIAPYGSRPPTSASERPSPEMHKFHLNSTTVSPPFSPHHPPSGFASINGPPSQSPNFQTTFRHDGGQGLSPRNSHPMAVSTTLAYGYMPPAHRAPTSPPDLCNSRQPPSSSTLPPLVHRDSSFHADLPNRQLPSLQLLESQRSRHMIMPIPTTEQSGRQNPGLATLLLAGEHLASQDVRPPLPIKHESSADGTQGGDRKGQPP